MLNKVSAIVKDAGIMMQSKNYEVHSKGSVSNYVTDTDIAVEQYLRKELQSLIPGSGFFGEESSPSDTDHEFLWVVDPIDGTANFVRHMNLSVISVGLLKNKEPYLGVIYNPFSKELFSAMKGKGAFLGKERLHVSSREFAASQFCIGFSLYKKDFAPACFRIMEQVYMECDDMRRLGSAALELSYLAAGRSDLYFEIRLFPWDYTGATIILTEAGGYCGTIGQKTLSYDHPIPLIAANTKENYDRLYSIVTSEIEEIPYTS